MALSGFKTPKIDPEKIKHFDIKAQSGCPRLLPTYDSPLGNLDPFPAWNNPPLSESLSKERIEQIFLNLVQVFGFQYDNAKNMYEYMLRLLDSRASRMGTVRALRSVHGDYIGGTNANFRKWYFAAQLDIDDNGNKTKYSLEETQSSWAANMNCLTHTDLIIQVALYLLCWGEANNIRFMPECLCFIFKCCNDYYYSIDPAATSTSPEVPFLDHVITPLYQFYQSQLCKEINGVAYHNDKDHRHIIGYDDMNQLFWYSKGLKKIVLEDKTKLMDLPAEQRYGSLNRVVWKKAFSKSFKELRSWSHILTNFSRVWIIHICMFWLYTSYNTPSLYTANYNQLRDNQPTIQAQLEVMSLAGSIACLITMGSILFESRFVPRSYAGAEPVFKRLFVLFILFAAITSPTVYFLSMQPLNYQSNLGLSVAAVQFFVSIITTIYLSFTPLGKLFGSRTSRKYLANRIFTSNFYKLRGSEKISSFGLWVSVFLLKFIESYFYLTLSLRDPIRELSHMKMTNCAGSRWIGSSLCYYQAQIVLILVILTDIVLFFLDTYLWYIVCNSLFSVCRSFYIGVSIWTPWRNVFSRLPKRIFSKIVSSPANNVQGKKIVSQIWNSVIISMYRDHLLSIEHVQKLIYKQVETVGSDALILKEPPFFVSQEDIGSTFYHQTEAERRITFFAQSLSTPMADKGPIDGMPSFSVLIPHYNEKITLSLREIIREDEQYSNITMLEYLKKLHPLEWHCFVKDTKLLAEEFDSEASTIEEETKVKDDEYPYHSVGFKVATPEYILRTRIWASLRTQTLYRTINGFMNYSRAIKLLYDVENHLDEYKNEVEKVQYASAMALRKFRIVVSMQRMKYFNAEEEENKEFLLRAYPELQIAYLDEETDASGKKTYYSVLIDGNCPILENGDRLPKYRIRLSGNPILGDGKSDNQNNSLIFTRGEYIQLIDANQDNYLEECLKIRNVLSEFEENSPPFDPYTLENQSASYLNPVAIIGTREYIFSENIGVLGDIAAGKEQTFGTLYARTLAHIGGKLHYGHPDFLNAIFMTTRGGVSKAQKGLHLNEDVYAGMNAISRGGRIKHCEYIQCGKGRDLGFGSILNFITKIGTGMGEQLLSREHFYFSTNLPLDRFLSYYYAHPGFHLNNVCIMLSIKLFLLVAVNVAAITNESIVCEYNRYRPVTDPRRPNGCHNLIPVVHWLERSIISIFIVFGVSFLPLFLQEVMERGFYKSVARLGKHFLSCSPLFEVFSCQIYSQSLVSDLLVGGARYIATGRGFATVRVPFSILYSRFAPSSLYFAARSFLLIFYASITLWNFPLIYFWVTIAGLFLCPFLYNPNQMNFNEFFIDYGSYLKWLFHGNTCTKPNSWINFVRVTRSRIIGVKGTTKMDTDSTHRYTSTVKPSRWNVLKFQSILELTSICFVGVAYLFSNALNDTRIAMATHAFLRIIIISFGPILVNVVLILVFFIFSLVFSPVFSCCFRHFPTVISTIVHILAIVNYAFFFELLWLFQNWDFSRTMLGLALVVSIQRFVLYSITTLLVSREYKHDKAQKAWWSGKWLTSGMGIHILTQPLREFVCKVTELSYFVADITLGHMILLPQFFMLFIPYVDKWHTMMLFWLKPSSQITPRLMTKKQRRRVRAVVCSNFLMFVLNMLVFASLLVVPLVLTKVMKVNVEDHLPSFIEELIQPHPINTNRKGLLKGLVTNS